MMIPRRSSPPCGPVTGDANTPSKQKIMKRALVTLLPVLFAVGTSLLVWQYRDGTQHLERVVLAGLFLSFVVWSLLEALRTARRLSESQMQLTELSSKGWTALEQASGALQKELPLLRAPDPPPPPEGKDQMVQSLEALGEQLSELIRITCEGASRQQILQEHATERLEAATRGLVDLSRTVERIAAEIPPRLLERGEAALEAVAGAAEKAQAAVQQEARTLDESSARATLALGTALRNLDATAQQTREVFLGAKAAVDELRRIRVGLEAAVQRLGDFEENSRESVDHLRELSDSLEGINQGLKEQNQTLGRMAALSRSDQGALLAALGRVQQAMERLSTVSKKF